MPLSCLEALSVSKDTHTWTLVVSPLTSTTSGVVNQVCGSQRVQFIFIQAYISMAPFGLPSSPNFFLNWEKKALILYSIKYFLPYFQLTCALENQRHLSNILFLITVGAGGRGRWGLPHSWLAFFLSRDSSLLIVAWDSFLFFFLLWDHCVWKEGFLMTNPDSRCLAEVEGQPGLLLLLLPPPLPLAWWNERMHVSTSQPLPTSFPCPPHPHPRSNLFLHLFLSCVNYF